ncbi:MAG: hypothetical protein ABJN36_16130 [Cyclobacteriaceae bacterium]
MKNKSLRSFLIINFLCLTIYSVSAGINDRTNFFTKEQQVKIEALCEKLERQYFLTTIISVYEDQKPPTLKNGVMGYEYLFLNIDLGDQAINCSGLKLSKEQQEKFCNTFLTRLKLVNFNNRDSLFASLKGALREIKNQLHEQKEHQLALAASHNKQKKFSTQLKAFIWLCIITIVVFIVVYTIKSTKPGNRFEKLEFYGLARINLSTAVIISVLIAILGVYSLRFFDEETHGYIALLCLIFTLYPLLVVVSGGLTFLKDLFAIKKYKSIKSTNISLGAKAFILNSSIPTDVMLELNFYHLLEQSKILLLFDKENFRHPHYIRFGKEEPGVNRKSFQPYFLKLKDPRTPIHLYLNGLYKRIGRFKAYRKDYIIQELFERGLIQKTPWLFNQFKLNEKGNLYRKSLLSDIAREEKNINEFLINSTTKTSILSNLSSTLLLHPDGKRALNEIRNRLSKHDLEKLPNQTSIYPFLTDYFDFSLFKRNLSKASSYKMEWSNSSDVTKWVIPV